MRPHFGSCCIDNSYGFIELKIAFVLKCNALNRYIVFRNGNKHKWITVL